MNKRRALCWRVIRWRHFELAILYVILLNTALMGLDGYGVGPAEAAALEQQRATEQAQRIALKEKVRELKLQQID